MKFLNAETHTPVLLMKYLQSPHPRDVRIWVSTVFFSFPERPKLRDLSEDQNYKGPVQKTHWRSRTSCRKIGDLITAYHKVLSESCESRNNHRYAIVVQDLATQWIQSYPCKTKTSQETQRILQKFLEPDRKSKSHLHCDNSLEFGRACEDLSWNHCTSTPQRSETNGIAERAVRRVKEGTSAVLLQACLNESWWADSMECYTYLRNVTDLLSDGKTPYERRFGQPFKGPIIPFGSLVECHHITAKDQSRIHQFGKKVLPGLFLGYALYAGVNLEGWRTGCRPWGVGDGGRIGNLPKKTQCERGDVSQGKRRIYCSNNRWANQALWRRSRPENIHLSIRQRPIQGESHLGFSWRDRRFSSTTSRLVSECRWSDKWLFVHVRKLQLPPSRWTQSQTLLARRRITPYSTEIHWCIQNYSYEFGCQARETHRWLLEYWRVKRFVRFLDRFHSFYSIGREISKRIYVVRVKTDKTARDTQTRSFMARTLDENGKKC